MYNLKLRQARKQKRWSIEKAAEEVGVSWLTFSRWEHGTQRPHPTSLDMLCDAFGMSPAELGFSDKNSQEIESDETMKRREALQKIATTTGALLMLSKLPGRSTLKLDRDQHQIKGSLTEEVLIGLATITQQYRVLQRSGVTTIEDGLHGHITTIQHTLEQTASDKYRRELWRQLALSQLLARLNITRKQELARAKTWNESAVASAQQSGDSILLGATIGHLAHLYLMEENDVLTAQQFIERAKELAHKRSALDGWLTIIAAATAAKAKEVRPCKNAIAQATEIAAGLSSKDTDAFFTDFSMVGVDAFAGNCLLAIGEPTEAYKRLTAMDLQALSENRHASAFYDLSRAYAAAGELEAMQAYAFQSIEKALATNRLYIIPRFLTLTQQIQRKDPQESHAAAIAEYARVALGQN
jgi:transcriptional regulator with XRE-family HTH domain